MKESPQIYYEMRNKVFFTTPEEIAVKPTAVLPTVYGVVMELGLESTATLIALADGTVSLYFETGGGLIGSGTRSNINEAAGRFIHAAENVPQESFQSAQEFPLPEQGGVRFYVLTYRGVLTAQAKGEALDQQDHPLFPLFFAGHTLLTELRMLEEQGKEIR